MEFTREANGVYVYDEAGQVIAEITFAETDDPNVVVADHTFVDPSLRGQGVAGQLLDELVAMIDERGQKIKPLCPYVVRKFQEESDKYADIMA